MEQAQAQTRVALLIDGENSTPTLIDAFLAKAETLGEVIIRRVYGNWSSPVMQGWQEGTRQYGFEQRHHGPTAVGKNASDIALVIDAMDLLHGGVIQHFCLSTSDSDFTPLVIRLRSAGCNVLVMGKVLTPIALQAACTTFVSIDQMLSSHSSASCFQSPTFAPESEQTKPSPSEELLTLLVQAYHRAATKLQKEWVPIPDLNSALKQLYPQFTAKAHGYKNLPTLMQHIHFFETRKQTTGAVKHLEVLLQSVPSEIST